MPPAEAVAIDATVSLAEPDVKEASPSMGRESTTNLVKDEDCCQSLDLSGMVQQDALRLRMSAERRETEEREDQRRWVEDLLARIDFDQVRKAQVRQNDTH